MTTVVYKHTELILAYQNNLYVDAIDIDISFYEKKKGSIVFDKEYLALTRKLTKCPSSCHK